MLRASDGAEACSNKELLKNDLRKRMGRRLSLRSGLFGAPIGLRQGHKNFVGALTSRGAGCSEVVSDWWAIRDDEAADAGTNIARGPSTAIVDRSLLANRPRTCPGTTRDTLSRVLSSVPVWSEMSHARDHLAQICRF